MGCLENVQLTTFSRLETYIYRDFHLYDFDYENFT